MKLSIFLSGIRPQNWVSLYQSVPNATLLTDYEFVIVSPYDLPPGLQKVENVRLIKDKGCPTRCYQLGLLHSRGEYVVWAADDGVFSPTRAIDKAFARISPHEKGIVMLRYLEGTRQDFRGMQKLNWWKLGHHRMLANAPYAPNHYTLIMLALMRRDYLVQVGGWDCSLEHVGLSCVDLSIRLQNDGAGVVVGEKLMDISLCRGNAGDHGPVQQAHKSDKRVFAQMYHHESGSRRARIDFDNWKNAPDVWPRRKF